MPSYVACATPSDISETTYLSSADVAKRFQVSLSTVSRWVSDGYLTATKMPGKRGRLRFAPDDVDALAARLVRKASAEAAAS